MNASRSRQAFVVNLIRSLRPTVGTSKLRVKEGELSRNEARPSLSQSSDVSEEAIFFFFTQS